MEKNEKSFPITIWSGLLTSKHFQRIGNAIWLFLLFIDKTTKENAGVGVVLGGKPVKHSDVAPIPFDISRPTYNKWLKKLEKHQYINLRRTSNGYVIKILKSKKWKNRNNKSSKFENNKDHKNTEVPKNFTSDDKSTNNQMTENLSSNKDITEDNTDDNIYTAILDYWNTKKIIIQNILEIEDKLHIENALVKYTPEEIETAISNYAMILKSEKYILTHEWSLCDFLMKGLNKFISKADPFTKYKRNMVIKSPSQEVKHIKRNDDNSYPIDYIAGK